MANEESEGQGTCCCINKKRLERLVHYLTFSLLQDIIQLPFLHHNAACYVCLQNLTFFAPNCHAFIEHDTSQHFLLF